MASQSTRTVWIATAAFVLIAVIIKLAGGPILDWLRALHGPAGGGGH